MFTYFNLSHLQHFAHILIYQFNDSNKLLAIEYGTKKILTFEHQN